MLQNFARVMLARKEYRSRVRKRELRDLIVQDDETALMREAEAECRYYYYRLKAVVSIQRVFRGHRGRKVFLSGVFHSLFNEVYS